MEINVKPDPDLAERCCEVLNWKRTGVLTGDKLRALAATMPDRDHALRLAETQTADEAMRYVIMAAADFQINGREPQPEIGRKDA